MSVITTNRSQGSKLSIAAAFACLLTYAVVFTITPASLNAIKSHFACGDSNLAAIPAVMMTGFVVASLLGGRISDKKGKLPVLTLGAAFMALGAILFVISPVFFLIILASLMFGIGGGLSEGLSMGVVADNSTDENRTLMMNVSQLVFCIGAVGAPMGVSQVLAMGLDWKISYYGASIICILTGILTFITLKKAYEKPPSADIDQHVSWGSLITNRMVIALSIAIMFYVGTECGYANWTAVYFKQFLNANESFAAKMVATFWGGIALGRALTAITSRYLSDEVLVILAFLFGAAFICTILAIPVRIPCAVMTFLTGTALGPCFPTVVSIAGRKFPNQTGSVFGIVVAAGSLGALIFPAIIGIGSDHIGLNHALWICPTISLFGGIIFLKIRSVKQAVEQINTDPSICKKEQ